MHIQPFRLLTVLPVLLATAASLTAQAQEEATPDSVPATVSIFDHLAQPEAGYGTVVIRQSEDIRRLVGIRSDSLITDGYRVQIFAGNDRRTSRTEAFEKENEVREVFPQLPTYVTYPAPFWRLRAGDLRTVEEARQLLHQLTQAFPAYAKEMYIVREEIRISLP